MSNLEGRIDLLESRLTRIERLLIQRNDHQDIEQESVQHSVPTTSTRPPA